MSKRMEKLTRIVARTLLLVFAFVVSEAPPAMGQSSTTEELPFTLLIEPIEGLTTARHKAPRFTALPVGTTLQVCHPLPGVKLPDLPFVRIRWEGADQVHRTKTMSWAECHLDRIGEYSVRAIVDGPNGAHWDHEMLIRVVDVPIDAIHVRRVTVSAKPFDLDEAATNEETMDYFFNKDGYVDSIATLQPVGREPNRLRPNKRRDKAFSSASRFRTSILRSMVFEFEVTPAEFAPLIEWRENGEATRLGAWRSNQRFRDVGVHTFSFGPPDRARTLEIETYEVQIISHKSGQDIVPEGRPVTFEAVTNPPGYEDDITWFSSTKYGQATPVLGYGPTFTVQFDNTFGDDPEMGLFQWLGVRADNATFGQDQKECQNSAQVLSNELTLLLETVPFTIDSFDVTLLDVVTSDNLNSWVNEIVFNSSIPSLSRDDPVNLAVGLIADDPKITQEQIDAYTSLIESFISVQSTILQVDYVSPTAGSFTTLAVVDQDCQLTFEALWFFVPEGWPDDEGEDLDNEECSSGFERGQTEVVRTASAGSLKNRAQGTCATFSVTATADCNEQGNIIGCTGTCGDLNTCAFMETECKVSSETIVGNCCRVKANFAYAFGFKSVSVGADGVTLSITGIGGTGSKWSRTVRACCQCE